MTQRFIVHRGSGTFIDVSECELVLVDDSKVYESIEDLDSSSIAIFELVDLISWVTIAEIEQERDKRK